MNYDEMTKDELQDEAARRNLRRSGTKAELIERLEHGQQNGDGTGSRDGIVDVLDRARRSFGQLTNLVPETVSRVEQVEDGWRATFEAVELARVPPSTDVLASYDVELDARGNLKAWSRGRRYLRNQQEET